MAISVFLATLKMGIIYTRQYAHKTAHRTLRLPPIKTDKIVMIVCLPAKLVNQSTSVFLASKDIICTKIKLVSQFVIPVKAFIRPILINSVINASKQIVSIVKRPIPTIALPAQLE